jgi:hypothetical protein
MSTKTIYKRIALVAVTALGAGVLSVAPASAVITSFYVHSKSASGGVVECAQTLTSSASTTITSGGGACLSDALTPAGTGIWTDEDGFIGAIVTNTTPAGGTAATIAAASPTQAAAAASWYKGTIATTTVASGVVADAISGMTVTAGAAGAFNLRGNDVATVNGAAKAAIGGQIISSATNTTRTTDDGIILPFTAPIAAGVYNVVITVKDAANYAATDPTINFTLTVVAASTLDLGLSTAFMTGRTDGANASSTTNAVARTGVKTAGTAISQIKVTLLKSDGTADTSTHRIDATVVGVGYVAANTTANTDPNSTARAANDSTGASVRYVHIEADGTAGTGTVTVTVTHAVTGVRSTLGTFSYTTYDDVAKLEVSTTNFTIGLAGGDSTGQAAAARTLAGNVKGALDDTTTAPAFVVKATDANGRVANATAAPTIVSSATTVVASGTCVLDDGATAGASSGTGVGFYNCAFTTAATSKSGDKATLTIRIVDPADATKFITTTIAVTVGGSISTETLAFNKTTYAPGEGMVITRTAKDASSNPVADGSASPAITFSTTVGGTTPAAGFYVGGVSASSSATANPTVFAPVTSGAFQALMTSGNATASKLSASATVGASADMAAITTLINSLVAKINALNKLVIKIQKKVRA